MATAVERYGADGTGIISVTAVANKHRAGSAPRPAVPAAVNGDGHTWLKYGEKNIANHVIRSYYRCAWSKSSDACPARKTVDFDPTHPTSTANSDSVGREPIAVTTLYRHAHNHQTRGPPPRGHKRQARPEKAGVAVSSSKRVEATLEPAPSSRAWRLAKTLAKALGTTEGGDAPSLAPPYAPRCVCVWDTHNLLPGKCRENEQRPPAQIPCHVAHRAGVTAANGEQATDLQEWQSTTMRCADATELCSALLWTPKSGRCGAAQDAMASAVWDDSMAAAVPHCVIAEGCSDAQDAQGAMMAGAVRLVECSSAVDDSAVATSGVAWLPDPLAALPVPPAGLDDVTFLSWEEMDLCPWGRPHHEDRQGRQDSEEDPHAALDVPPMGSCLNSSGVESSVRGAYEIMGGGVAEPPPGAPMGGVMLVGGAREWAGEVVEGERFPWEGVMASPGGLCGTGRAKGGEQAGVDELQAGMLQQEQQQEQQQNQHVHHPVFDVLGGGNSMSVWDFIH